MVEEEIRLTEEELEELEREYAEKYGSPDPPIKDSILKFFREILKQEDTTRIGNLVDGEIGKPKYTIRGLQNVANYAEFMGYPEVFKYLTHQSYVTTSTSMSRKGFLASLFVTQIKKEQKIIDKPKTIQKGFWGKPKEVEANDRE